MPASRSSGGRRPSRRSRTSGRASAGGRTGASGTPARRLSRGGGDDRHWLLRNGTFMVWRKLEQRADWMKRFFEKAAGGDPERRRWLEAKVVGRWKDGTSLLNAPYAQPPHREPEGRPSNEFD